MANRNMIEKVLEALAASDHRDNWQHCLEHPDLVAGLLDDVARRLDPQLIYVVTVTDDDAFSDTLTTTYATLDEAKAGVLAFVQEFFSDNATVAWESSGWDSWRGVCSEGVEVTVREVLAP